MTLKKHQKWYSPKEAISLVDSINISGNPNAYVTIISKYNQKIDSDIVSHLYLLSGDSKKSIAITRFFAKLIWIAGGLLENSANDANISIDSCYLSTPGRKK